MKKLIKLALVSSLLLASLSSFALETTVAFGAASSYSQFIFSLATSSQEVEVAELNVIKDDAVNFLANDVSTDALKSFIADFKAKNPRFVNVSDKEVALALSELE